MVQPDTALRSLEVLRAGGLFVGIAPGRPEGFADRAASAGVRLAPEPLVEPDGHGLAELAGLVDAGELTVRLDRVFPLDQAAQAHVHAENGATGKTVLHIAG
jgi:NADPH:quinone reductase-like Zn-dependent oxidoreductase